MQKKIERFFFFGSLLFLLSIQISEWMLFLELTWGDHKGNCDWKIFLNKLSNKSFHLETNFHQTLCFISWQCRIECKGDTERALGFTFLFFKVRSKVLLFRLTRDLKQILICRTRIAVKKITQLKDFCRRNIFSVIGLSAPLMWRGKNKFYDVFTPF